MKEEKEKHDFSFQSNERCLMFVCAFLFNLYVLMWCCYFFFLLHMTKGKYLYEAHAWLREFMAPKSQVITIIVVKKKRANDSAKIHVLNVYALQSLTLFSFSFSIVYISFVLLKATIFNNECLPSQIHCLFLINSQITCFCFFICQPRWTTNNNIFVHQERQIK